MAGAVNPVNRSAVKIDLENDRRDVKDLWNDALRAYKGILGEDLKPTFSSVDAMIKSGTDQMNGFHKWRHDDSKVDKLRSLFMANIGYVETGTQKLIAAAEPAFPPAAAIGTAITFILSACKSVSADYDVVTAFFEDMNSFLQRVSILETRLPGYRAYQACLMDVFTSLLTMCAFARKFIKLGRLKKWVINAFRGEDDDLAGSRKTMDKALVRLQSATEFAILANTENLAEGQQSLQSMQDELKKNQEMQYQLAESQQLMLQTMLERQADVRDEIGDIKKLVQALQRTEIAQGAASVQSRAKSAVNAVRSIISEVPENDLQLQMLQDSHLSGSCGWIFGEPVWKSWYRTSDSTNDSPLLLLRGPEGIGKSHIAVALYEYISSEIDKDPGSFSCVVYFFAQDGVANLKTFQSIINCAVLQISEQNTLLRDQLNAKLSRDGDRIKDDDYFKELISPMFDTTSKYCLYIVVDAVDALETNIDRDSIFNLADTIKQHNLRIKVVATTRPHIKPTKKHDHGHQDLPIAGSELLITKDKILPDLKAILQDRLQSTDSAFRGIRYLSPNTKQAIASKLEEKADGLLYVEQALLFFSSLGREAAIVRLLTENMPLTGVGWFYRLIKKCERRTPADLTSPLHSVLTWLLFSFDSLSLAGFNRLLQMETGKNDIEVEDEIVDIYGEFLRLQSTATYSKDRAHATTIVESLSEPTGEDGNAQLMFRERSMKNFFLKRQAAARAVRISHATSFGHRQLFLACCRVISEHQDMAGVGSTIPEGHHDLHRYALTYCLRHWRRISCNMHSNEDNAQIYEAFVDLVSGTTGFSTQIEHGGVEFTIDELLTFHKHAPDVDWDHVFFEGWTEWSKWLQDESLNHNASELTSRLTPTALEYWHGDQTHALIPLAMSHVRNWLMATEPNAAIVAYNFARKALKKTSMHVLLCQQVPIHVLDMIDDSCSFGDPELSPMAWHNEILNLRSIMNSDLNSNSHFVTAVLTNTMMENNRLAFQEMEAALEKCQTGADNFRYLIYLGKLHYWSEWVVEDALRYFDLGFKLRDTVSKTDFLLALQTKATILRHSGEMEMEALTVIRQIRHLDTEGLVADTLLEDEFLVQYGRQDWPALMKYYMGLKSFHRLNLVLTTNNWQISRLDIHFVLLQAAVVTNKVKDLIRTYISIFASLKANDMGPVWGPWLAHAHWAVEGDVEAAKAVLTKALDTLCTTQEYPLVNMDSGFIAIRNVNMMTDIVFEQFQNSRDPDTKMVILEEQASRLLQRHLPQSVQISDASTIPHLLVVANMTRKIGRPQDYEKLLRRIFDIAWINLHDTITWNDAINLCHLSRVVAQIPGLQREAEILNSSQLYHLGEHSFFAAYCQWKGINISSELASCLEKADTKERVRQLIDQAEGLPISNDELFEQYELYDAENPGGYSSYPFLEDKGDVETQRWRHFAPRCTRMVFCSDKHRSSWNDGPLYTCLTCTDSRLCQQCYDTRRKWNKEGKPDGQVSFCCKNGQYIKSPAQHWLGIKHQNIHLEGEAPIKFEDFLQQVRARWNEYWDQFWLG